MKNEKLFHWLLAVCGCLVSTVAILTYDKINEMNSNIGRIADVVHEQKTAIAVLSPAVSQNTLSIASLGTRVDNLRLSMAQVYGLKEDEITVKKRK